MARYNVAPLENLVDQFEKMPGIGHKTAQRLAYYVLNLSKTEAEALAAAVTEAHTRIHYCGRCCNLTDKELCPVCASPSRDHSVICVVETPRDATAVENTHEFQGVYHVLHGSISPLNGISPEELTVKELRWKANLSSTRLNAFLKSQMPSKSQAMAVVLGMGLDLTYARQLLATARLFLDATEDQDLLVEYCMTSGQHDAILANQLLFAMDLPQLIW